MEKWTELRTAYKVAKLGTVSAAAEALGFHRATVNRHVDVLEAELGARIFIRHTRGYTLTELGNDVLRTIQKAEELIDDLAGRASVENAHIDGEIKLTTIAPFSRLIIEPSANFRLQYPHCQIHVAATENLERLEHGEAHIALRAGTKPDHPDYVVQHLRKIYFNLYAHDTYVEKYGLPLNGEDFTNHYFILPSETRRPKIFEPWITKHVGQHQISLCTNHLTINKEAIASGLGIGFLSNLDVAEYTGLHPVLPHNEAWSLPIWLVTHVDLHQTVRVQAMLKCLKDSQPL